MKMRLRFALVATVVLVTPIRSQERPPQPETRKMQGSALAFEANTGQFPPEVSFGSRGRGYTLLLGTKETTVISADGEAQIQFSLIGGRVAPAIGLDQQPGVVNYLIGNDPSRWHVGVPTFARVRYEDLLPGVDLEFYERNGLHEYDFVVAPGVDPAAIMLDVNGAQTLELDDTGNLRVAASGALMTMRAPVVYQMVAGERREVSARYVLNGPSRVGFELDSYDPRAPVIIDPQLVYGTFLGGSGNGVDQFLGVDTDAEGNAYVVGMTENADFPTLGSNPPSGARNGKVVVIKFAPDGRMVYSTILGGSGYDGGGDIAVRSDGTAYIVGSTTSSDFPVREAFQRNYGGVGDAFVVALNREGTAITHGTYLGGSDNDVASGIELARPVEDALADPNRSTVFGDVLFVYGSTQSPNFPTLNPVQSRRVGERDAFVTMLDRQTLQPRFSTYAGAEGDNRADALVINHKRGDAYLWLYREDDDKGPLFVHLKARLRPSAAGSNGPQKESFNDYNDSAFVEYIENRWFKPLPKEQKKAKSYTAKPRTCGSKLIVVPGSILPDGTMCGDVFTQDLFRRALASSAPSATADELRRSVLVVFAAGCLPVAPSTTCTERASAVFFDADLQATAFVNLGGSGVGRNFVPTEMVADLRGRLHFIGTTSDTGLPVQNPIQAGHAGSSEGFILSINPLTQETSFFSYLGGGSFDTLTDIAVDKSGNLWIVGTTQSADFPVTRSGAQPEMRGRIDGFVVKISQ